jgi:hypothetical protein
MAHDGAVTTPAVVNQRDRLSPFMHRNLMRNGLIAHGVQHGMAGAVGDVTGAPLIGAAEGTLGNQAMGFVALGDGDFLPVHDDLAIALAHTAPGHAPGRQLTHCFGRGIDEHAHDVLVGAPVAAADGVLEVHVFVVALAMDDVGEARLHAALRCR